MTVQYEGGNTYKIFIGQKELMLSQDEINEIQDYNFYSGESIGDEVEELEEDIDKIRTSASKISQKLFQVVKDIKELLEFDIIFHSNLEKQIKQISQISDELDDI